MNAALHAQTSPWPGTRLALRPISKALAQPLPWCGATLLQAAGLAAAVPKRRDEFLAGRRCAHEALAALGAGPATPVARAQDGAPLWPQGVTGAISHGAGWAAALVSRDPGCLGLGVDVEACFADDTWVDLAPQFLSPRERALLRPGREAWIATLCFSFKECLIKAVLPRLQASVDFLSCEVLALDFGRRRAALRLPSAALAVFGPHCVLQAQWQAWPSTTEAGSPAAVLTALQLTASSSPQS